MEATAAFLVYLVAPDEGLRRMENGLSSTVPLARMESAACLAMVGARDLLRRSAAEGSREANAVLAVLRGEDPEPGPEPQGTTVSWQGQPKTVYSIAELVAAEFEDHTFGAARSFWETHMPWFEHWNAS